MTRYLTWEKGWYHIPPWLLYWTNKIRLEEVDEYYNATISIVSSDILEYVMLGEVLKDYIIGSRIEVNIERHKCDFTSKLSWYWWENVYNGIRDRSESESNTCNGEIINFLWENINKEHYMECAKLKNWHVCWKRINKLSMMDWDGVYTGNR